MWMDALYVAAGLFYTLCIELFVLFMMVCFQAFPGRFFIIHQKAIGRILLVCSLIAGIIGGVCCTIEEGYVSVEQYFIAIFPILFIPLLIGGFVTDAKKESKRKENELEEDLLEFYLEEGAYTIDSRVDTWNGQMRAINIAYCEDKAIRFMVAVPRKAVTIKAYCKKTEKDNQYLCVKYEEVKADVEGQENKEKEEKALKERQTLKDRMEFIHTVILELAALSIPLPTLPAFMWYKTYGVGENPYIGLMVYSLIVVVFGGCRKLFLHSHGFTSKIQHFIFSVFYYLMLIVWIVYGMNMLITMLSEVFFL